LAEKLNKEIEKLGLAYIWENHSENLKWACKVIKEVII
jgi:hypothetical protein